ncbi:MAG: hypothetical protein RMY29_031575 [Nostoc sp. CreGUA01]|nr:hypothetical protein [Nostoc sp. CreGUA01]
MQIKIVDSLLSSAELINPEKLRAVGASVVFNDMKLLPKLLDQQNQPFINSGK